MSSLQDELGNMRLEETLGAALVKNLEDPHGSANARLLAHLDQVRIGVIIYLFIIRIIPTLT